MSDDNLFRCPRCYGRSFTTLLAAVKHVVSEKGGPLNTVKCFVQHCSKSVHHVRLHIRRCHPHLCEVSCPVCPAKFVEESDLNNHRRNGCPQVSRPRARRRKKKAGNQMKTMISAAKPYQCDICQRSFASNHGKMQHQKDKHEQHAYVPRINNSTDEFLSDLYYNPRGINGFIEVNLQLADNDRTQILSVIDELYRHLQRRMPSSYTVHNLIKGGSVGKGTAVKDKADIDCVVFLNNFKTMQEHKRYLDTTKKVLEECLQESPHHVQIGSQTPFAVKFKISPRNSPEAFDVDLLPTFNTNKSTEQLYEEMFHCSENDRRYYSAALVNRQVEFVKYQPPNVKNLIRLVKYWRKTCIEDKANGSRLPSSYPLELITIHCWEKAGRPGSFDTRAGFKSVLQRLVGYHQINAVWYENYDAGVAAKGKACMPINDRRPPFVLDPANPTNNVCSASDPEGWQTVANAARTTLEDPRLGRLCCTHDWQIIV